MNDALPLVVAVPLVGAAVLGLSGPHTPKRIVQLLAIGVAATTTAFCFMVLVDAWPHEAIHWFGGWRPDSGHEFGIGFVTNGLDAAMACTASLLVTAAMLFAFSYYEEAGHFFHVLMLVFLGGLTGFSVTGDLFDLFVFFELMSVSAYALCGYSIEQPSVLQGALNFAILNTMGSFFIVMGIALTYAKTGALNLAQIGAALSGQPPKGTVAIAMMLLVIGLLVKGGAVPFHFWLSDAYAVAPAPAGALFAGIMSDLALHTIARIYWTCFSGSVGPDAHVVRDALLSIGVASAVVGAIMCFLQADTKRQLAFLVISHGGVFLCGYALLTGDGVGAGTLYVVTDGLLKGAVFLLFGATVALVGASDELRLHARGRHRRNLALGGGLAVAALAMAPLPGLGPWLGATYLQDAASRSGLGWLPWVLGAATAVTSAALLRATARIFLGWGGSSAPFLSSEPDEPEEGETHEKTPGRPRVLATPWLLIVVGAGAAFAPSVTAHAHHLGQAFVDLKGYVDEVLHGRVPSTPTALHGFAPAAGAWAYGAAASAASVGLAALGLWWSRIPAAARAGLRRLAPAVRVLKTAHSGAVGDYALWLTAGAATLLVVVVLGLR